jgi:replication fork clamp-binding protein CrfC
MHFYTTFAKLTCAVDLISDTEGTVINPVGDQPHDIGQRIEEMIMSYIQKPNTIILAVSAANSDLATASSLSLVRSDASSMIARTCFKVRQCICMSSYGTGAQG